MVYFYMPAYPGCLSYETIKRLLLSLVVAILIDQFISVFQFVDYYWR